MTRPLCDATVREVIPNTSLEDLLPFILSANKMVDKLASSSCGSSLDDATLEEIEKWLSAHFASIADPKLNIINEKVEGASVTVARGNFASHSGIKSSPYGQMADTLSGGCLGEITKPTSSVDFF